MENASTLCEFLFVGRAAARWPGSACSARRVSRVPARALDARAGWVMPASCDAISAHAGGRRFNGSFPLALSCAEGVTDTLGDIVQRRWPAAARLIWPGVGSGGNSYVRGRCHGPHTSGFAVPRRQFSKDRIGNGKIALVGEGPALTLGGVGPGGGATARHAPRFLAGISAAC